MIAEALLAASMHVAWTDSGHAIWKQTPKWIRSFGQCVREHESINAGHYRANNPVSSASGAYQALQAFWDGNARHATWKGKRVARPYVGRPASAAPPYIQDIVFIHSVTNDGLMAWKGTGCGHGT